MSIGQTIDLIIGVIKGMRGDPFAWERSIRRFEAQDRKAPPAPGQILFTGSSSINFWSTLKLDMAPLPVLNRGFGGAKIQDTVTYVDRIVLPYQPSAVVLFAGTNDIAWPKPAPAQAVLDGCLAFVAAIHAAQPQTPIVYISITPTPSRWKYWPIANEANRLILEATDSDPRLHFIDMTPHVLGPDGLPQPHLFRRDKLHPNRAGYDLWTAIIKPYLQANLPPGQP